jgi:hypothetical protein
MIDETRSRIPIWLLWARTKNDLVTLAAIALTERHAKSYKATTESFDNVVKVNVERSEANHLFNPHWDDMWEAVYGEEFVQELSDRLDTVATQRVRQLEYELSRYKVKLKMAVARIKELEGRK